MSNDQQIIESSLNKDYEYGFVTDIESETLPPGLNNDVIRTISKKKNEPDLSPLYEVGKEIKYVLNVNDIQNLFNETNINKNSKKLRNYSKNYFLELNKTKLKTILK